MPQVAAMHGGSDGGGGAVWLFGKAVGVSFSDGTSDDVVWVFAWSLWQLQAELGSQGGVCHQKS